MSVEREFATEFGGRLLAIEAVLSRILARMPERAALLDQVEMLLDKAHADQLASVAPDNKDVFLDMMRAASVAVGKMRDEFSI